MLATLQRSSKSKSFCAQEDFDISASSQLRDGFRLNCPVGNEKATITNQQNEIFLKPASADDPRLIGTMVAGFRSLLEQKGVDTVATREQKAVRSDEISGRGFKAQLATSSVLMKRVAQFMLASVKAFAPADRVRPFE